MALMDQLQRITQELDQLKGEVERRDREVKAARDAGYAVSETQESQREISYW